MIKTLKNDQKELYVKCMRMRAHCNKNLGLNDEAEKDCMKLNEFEKIKPDFQTLNLLGQLYFEMGSFNESLL